MKNQRRNSAAKGEVSGFLRSAKSSTPDLVRWRRDFHAHPEPAFGEKRTARTVVGILETFGCTRIQKGIAGTGVVCDIGGRSGPTVALRADMDALPIQDGKTAPYASKVPGMMHACGHDGHVAMLLGAARLLSEWFSAAKRPGRVRLVFQPAEENHDENNLSGAEKMVREGVLDGVDSIFGIHLDSTRPLGTMLLKPGLFTAAVDTFYARILGNGGHGAYPHDSRDPLWMLIPILSAMHGIPARRVDPLEPSVVSVCLIRGGTAANVIPAEVYLEGTLRSFSPEVREQLVREVEGALALSRGLGGDYRLEVARGYPPTRNEPRMVRIMEEAAKTVAGIDSVLDASIGMGAEDFAYFCEVVPGALAMVGAAVSDGISRPHHSPLFDFDEKVLPHGAALLAASAAAFLTNGLSG